MANQRKIITGVHISAKEGVELEDTSSGHKYVIDTTIGKSLGGNSSVATAPTQWNSTIWYKDALTIGYGVTQLNTHATALKFLYIKNNDATTSLQSSFEDLTPLIWTTSTVWGSATMYWAGGMGGGAGWILIPAGGSVQMRGDGANLSINDVHVRNSLTPGNTMNIEYVLAN